MEKRWLISYNTSIDYIPGDSSNRACSTSRGTIPVKLMFYFTYALRSKKDSKLYVGYCNDLIRRLKEHRTGKVSSTRSRLPVELIYYEACTSKDKAIKREKYFKTGFGRRFLKNRI